MAFAEPARSSQRCSHGSYSAPRSRRSWRLLIALALLAIAAAAQGALPWGAGSGTAASRPAVIVPLPASGPDSFTAIRSTAGVPVAGAVATDRSALVRSGLVRSALVRSAPVRSVRDALSRDAFSPASVRAAAQPAGTVAAAPAAADPLITRPIADAGTRLAGIASGAAAGPRAPPPFRV